MDIEKLEEQFKKLSINEKNRVFNELKKNYDIEPNEENTILLKSYLPILKEALQLDKDLKELDTYLDNFEDIESSVLHKGDIFTVNTNRNFSLSNSLSSKFKNLKVWFSNNKKKSFTIILVTFLCLFFISQIIVSQSMKILYSNKKYDESRNLRNHLIIKSLVSDEQQSKINIMGSIDSLYNDSKKYSFTLPDYEINYNLLVSLEKCILFTKKSKDIGIYNELSDYEKLILNELNDNNKKYNYNIEKIVLERLANYPYNDYGVDSFEDVKDITSDVFNSSY